MAELQMMVSIRGQFAKEKCRKKERKHHSGQSPEHGPASTKRIDNSKSDEGKDEIDNSNKAADGRRVVEPQRGEESAGMRSACHNVAQGRSAKSTHLE